MSNINKTNTIHFSDLPSDLQIIIIKRGYGLAKSIYNPEYTNPSDWDWIIDGDEYDYEVSMSFTFKYNDKYYLSKHSRSGGGYGSSFDFEFSKEFTEIYPYIDRDEKFHKEQVNQEYLLLLAEKKEIEKANIELEAKYQELELKYQELEEKFQEIILKF